MDLPSSSLDLEMKSESDDSDFDPNNKDNCSEDNEDEEDSCLGDDEYKSENDSLDATKMIYHRCAKEALIDDLINGKVEPKEETQEDYDDDDETKSKTDNKDDGKEKTGKPVQFAAGTFPLDSERYRVWKKNCPFLYDIVMTNQLEWPSYTVQWCNHKQIKMNPLNYREYFLEKLLYGTQVAEHHTNYVVVATQQIPVFEEKEVAADENGVIHNKYPKLEIYVRIVHDGNVNRARYNPQNQFIIATSSSKAKNYIFDYSKHPSEPYNKDFKPDLILDNHQSEGYGLCWNNRRTSILATGSYDETICVWDINSNPSKLRTLKPINSFKAHDFAVNDVKWHYYHDSYLGSVGSDRMLKFWDLRMNTNLKTAFDCRAHNDDINSLSFNKFCEYIILTASDDYSVGLFDIRNLRHKLHSFLSHGNQVLDVNWSPYSETVFASSGKDCRLILWDMSRIDLPQTPLERKEGPPEMIFIHGGHTAMIQDFAWHPHNQSIASVSTNNELHIFKPSIDIKPYEHSDSNSNSDSTSNEAANTSNH